MDIVKDELSLHGYVPIISGKASKKSKVKNNNSKKIEGGDAVALGLSTGDIEFSAVGTVTYCNKDDILIFGHQAFDRGILDVPLMKAIVYYSVPNYNLSFKLAGTLDEVGATTYDDKVAVAGKLGKKSSLIPVNISVDNKRN